MTTVEGVVEYEKVADDMGEEKLVLYGEIS
jgi:hypothetical protein